MNILKIVYDWPPPWLGLAPHPYELTRSQVKLGHKFWIFSGRWPRAGESEEPEGVTLLHFMNNSGLPHREPLKGTLLVTFSVLLLFRYIMWRKKNEVDLIHCHGHFALWIYFYRYLLQRYQPDSEELKTPFVVHFHNTVEGRWQKLLAKGEEPSLISKLFDWPLARWSDKLACKVADAMIFVSEENKKEAIKFYDAKKSKCHVIESGVNPKLFKPVGREEYEKVHKDLGIDPRDRVILYLSTIVERKNPHVLIEALKYLPIAYKLLLVGPIPDADYEKKIELLLASDGIKGRVIRGGFIPYPEVPILYQAAELFVLPSSFEGDSKGCYGKSLFWYSCVGIRVYPVRAFCWVRVS